MNIEEAIKTRRSVRAFTDQEVPENVVKKIFELAIRAPSGTNTQPWHAYTCAGTIREKIITDVSKLFDAGLADKYEDYEYYPPEWKDIHKERRRKIGWDLYGLLGIKKGDRVRTAIQAKRNFCFFDAPVGIFFTTDAYLARGSWSDVGLFMQTFMLAARAEGLHTCPQAAWITFQGPIFKHLQIPSDQVIVSGMALGYEDTNAVENTLESEREPVDQVVKFYGF
tara:strand:- start:511 stop:1182 length:672 start_codon:yes stop_codon:yes gene_type:complete